MNERKKASDATKIKALREKVKAMKRVCKAAHEADCYLRSVNAELLSEEERELRRAVVDYFRLTN